MNDNERIRRLVDEALAELESHHASISMAMRKAIRVARLRGDWDAVYWLSIELDPLNDATLRAARMAEVAPHYEMEGMRALHVKSLEQSITSRSIGLIGLDGRPSTGTVTSLSVPELELLVRPGQSGALEPLPPQIAPLDAAMLSEERRQRAEYLDHNQRELAKVLARLGQRVHTYLSRVERDISRGITESNLVVQNIHFVERRLSEVAPVALDQLKSAQVRAGEGTSEGNSQALLSCRRALKTLADVLYPPRATPVIGSDGVARILDDSKFVNRLWQFVAEAVPGSTAREVLQEEIDALGRKVEHVNDLSSKGVHSTADDMDTIVCITSLYDLVGKLLRLHDRNSGATIDPDAMRDLADGLPASK